jgi:hypothetical protein
LLRGISNLESSKPRPFPCTEIHPYMWAHSNIQPM